MRGTILPPSARHLPSEAGPYPMVMSLLARPLHEKIAIETILRDRKAGLLCAGAELRQPTYIW